MNKYDIQRDQEPLQIPLKTQDYIAQGLKLRAEEKFLESIAMYSLGLIHDPFAVMLYRHRGHAHLNLGEFSQAVADFEMGLRLDWNQWDCWYHLGVSYYLLNEFSRSVDVLTQCLTKSADPDLYTATVAWLWSALVSAGDTQAAANLIDQYPWEAKVTAESAGYYERIQVYAGKRDVDDVLKQAQTADDHMYATTAYGLGLYLDMIGRVEDAQEVYQTIEQRHDKWFGFAEHAARIRLHD